MAKTYFGLFTRDPGNDWDFQFGDYDRETVAQERLDWLDSDGFRVGAKARDARVEKMTDGRDAYRPILERLNAPQYRVGGSRRTYTLAEANARCAEILSRKGVFVSLTLA